MSCRFLILALSMAFFSAKAQFVVLPGTIATTGNPDIIINSAGNVVLGDDKFDLSNAKLAVNLNGANLSGTGIMVHSHTTRFQLDVLGLNSSKDYELRGTWLVSKALTLTNGKLSVKNTTVPIGRLIYTGNADAITASSSSYVNGPMFTAGTSQSRTYPIGNTYGYYPAQVIDVSDATALLRMEVINTTPSTAPISLAQLVAQFPENIDSLITDRYYNFKVFNASSSFSGVPVALSLNGITIDESKHIPVIVELDTASNAIKNLEGSPQSDFILSAGRTTSYGGKYMIATSKDVAVKIHKLITANGDGFNDELFIEGIDLYKNKVTLLDRWGGAYLTVQNFKNGQGDIDYSKLVNGNYICVVEYTDSKGITHKPKPQMITVLK